MVELTEKEIDQLNVDNLKGRGCYHIYTEKLKFKQLSSPVVQGDIQEGAAICLQKMQSMQLNALQ